MLALSTLAFRPRALLQPGRSQRALRGLQRTQWQTMPLQLLGTIPRQQTQDRLHITRADLCNPAWYVPRKRFAATLRARRASRHSRSGSQCTSTLARSGVRRSASRRSAIRRSALRRSTLRRSTLRRSIYSSETAAPYRFMRRTRSNPQRISRIHSRTRRPLASWTMSLLQKPKHLPDMPLVQPTRRLKTQSAKR